MGQFNAFSHADEVDSVLADDIATAHGLHADLFLAALTAHAFTMIVGDFVVITIESIGNDFAHTYGCSRGRVFLLVVVQFNDLDIEAFAEGLGHILEQLEADVDTNTHVRCKNHRR